MFNYPKRIKRLKYIVYYCYESAELPLVVCAWGFSFREAFGYEKEDCKYCPFTDNGHISNGSSILCRCAFSGLRCSCDITPEGCSVRAEYDKIPGNVIACFESLGNYITFFDGYEPEYSQLLGIYAGAEGQGCLILTNTNYDGAGTLIHEMAHFLDDYVFEDIGSEKAELNYNGHFFKYARGGIRSRSELEDFKAIYLEERAGNYLVSNYEAQDQCEYFAGSFAAYVNHPAELAVIAPKTYAFINNMIINV